MRAVLTPHVHGTLDHTPRGLRYTGRPRPSGFTSPYAAVPQSLPYPAPVPPGPLPSSASMPCRICSGVRTTLHSRISSMMPVKSCGAA